MYLDCETDKKTKNSFIKIFSISNKELNNFLKSQNNKLKLQNIREDSKTLYNNFRKEFRINDDINFDGIYFFHATRTLNINDILNNGILNLSEAKIIIKTKLKKYIPKHLHQQFDEVELFNNRNNNKLLWGPEAFLIKEEIDYIESNFLGRSEYIKDLCDTFNERTNFNLYDDYIKNSKSYIIKFKTNLNTQSYLESALLYLFLKSNNKKVLLKILSRLVVGFDGKGNNINKEDIIEIF